MKRHDPHRDERGAALIIVLVVLASLSFAGIGIAMSTLNVVRATTATNESSMVIYAADAGLWESRAWLRGNRFLGPPSRINRTSITDPADPHYYNVRNWGNMGDSDSATASEFATVAADRSLGGNGAAYWYLLRIDPNGRLHRGRSAGEEAGSLVTYGYDVETASTRGRAQQRGRLRLEQTYNLSPYGG